jgi:hypothetical protein
VISVYLYTVELKDDNMSQLLAPSGLELKQSDLDDHLVSQVNSNFTQAGSVINTSCTSICENNSEKQVNTHGIPTSQINSTGTSEIVCPESNKRKNNNAMDKKNSKLRQMFESSSSDEDEQLSSTSRSTSKKMALRRASSNSSDICDFLM